MLNKKVKFPTKILLTAVLSALLVWSVSGPFVKAKNHNEDNDNNNDNGSIMDLLHGKGVFNFNDFPSDLEEETISQNASLNINPNGRVIITSAIVTQANWPNLQVKVWGITLNITVLPDAKVHGAGITTPTTSGSTSTPSTVINIAVGDNVDIVGTINNDTGVISANNFRDRSQTSALIKTLQQKIQDLLKQLRQLQSQLQGVNNNF